MSEHTSSNNAPESGPGALGSYAIDHEKVDDTDNGEALVDGLISSIVTLVDFGTRSSVDKIDGAKHDVRKAREAVESRIWELACALADSRTERRKELLKLDDAEEQLEARTAELQNADRSIASLAATLETATQQQREADVARAQLEYRHEQRGIHLAAANRRLVDVEKASSEWRAAAGTLANRVLVLEREARQQLADAEQSIAQLGRKIATMNDQAARHSQEYAELQEQLDAARKLAGRD